MDTTNADFRAALLRLVRKANAKTRKRLETALLEELESTCDYRDRSCQTVFVLELLKECGFDRWSCSTYFMDSIFNSDIAEIKSVAFSSFFFNFIQVNIAEHVFVLLFEGGIWISNSIGIIFYVSLIIG